MIRTAGPDGFKDLAICLGVGLLLYAAMVFIPVAGQIASAAVPFPFLMFRVKYGKEASLRMLVITCVACMLITRAASVPLLFYIGLSCFGWMLGHGVSLRQPLNRIMVSAVVSVAGLSAAGLAAISVAMQKSAGDWLAQTPYVTQRTQEIVSVLAEIGTLPDNTGEVTEMIVRAFVYMLPGQLIMNILVIALLNLLLARHIMITRKLFPIDLGILRNWKAPKPVVWGLIGCICLLLTGNMWLGMAALNGLAVMMTILLFQGIANCAYYAHNRAMPPMIRLLLGVIILLQPLLWLVIMTVGLLDVWFDFRKLGKIDVN